MPEHHSKSHNSVNMTPVYKIILLTVLIQTGAILFSGCNKTVQVSPPVTSITGASVFNANATAIAVLTGLYTQMSETGYNSIALGLPSLSAFGGLSSDELSLWSGATSSTNLWNIMQTNYYFNALSSTPVSSYGGEFWSSFYASILTCNAAIEGLNSSTGLDGPVRQQLLGEAKVMRALLYFYLVNLYGDVPLATSSDYKVNSQLARTAASLVYKQIVADLADAQNLLTSGYLDVTLLKSTTERVRPNKWLAASLLARTYLYTQKWDSAVIEATAVINNSLYSLTSLSGVFQKNSPEAIWQLQPVNPGWNTEDARLFIFPAGFGPTLTNPVYLSYTLLDSFEIGDLRRTNWIDSTVVGGTIYYYPYKYRSATNNAPMTEYLMIFRLAEQYLIRAEAETNLNDFASAESDLNRIRNRAGLPNTVANDRPSLLAAIGHERQTELFCELAHRWLDIKRTGEANVLMSNITVLKGSVWKSTNILYPLPFTDLQRDPQLTQNAGY